jgi:hypothetical protein
MNMHEAGRILRILRTVWPEAPVNQDTVTAWAWAFEDIPYELVEDAAKRWIRTGKFFPKPGELLRTIGIQAVAPDLVPEAAWTEVKSEARRVGYHRLPPLFAGGRFVERERPVFSHPLIAEAVASVGWDVICTGDDSRGFVREQFIRTMERLIEREVQRFQTGEGRLQALGSSPGPALPEG